MPEPNSAIVTAAWPEGLSSRIATV
jgi:hypothetical protein